MKYYVMTRERDDGAHVVHREDCQFLPKPDNRKALGDAASPDTAVSRAKEAFGDSVHACRTCCTG